MDSVNKISPNINFDIVTICAPDKQHFKLLKDVINIKPKLVIIEKPLSDNPDHTKKIVNLNNDKKIKLIVNYTRRFIPFYKNLAVELKNQKIISSQILYGNGIMHNGCHIIDLLKMLFGSIKSYQVLSHLNDYSSTDPTVSVFLQTQKCPSCFMIGLDNRKFIHWEMDIFTNNYHYKIFNDHKFLIEKVKNNIGTPLGKRFVFDKKIKIDYDVALQNIYLKQRII